MTAKPKNRLIGQALVIGLRSLTFKDKRLKVILRCSVFVEQLGKTGIFYSD